MKKIKETLSVILFAIAFFGALGVVGSMDLEDQINHGATISYERPIDPVIDWVEEISSKMTKK